MPSEESSSPIRVLIAKAGLDGHDTGAKVVVQALMEAGMEVIYTGLHQTVEQVVASAEQEDVNVIGLSILSGAHLPFCERLIFQLKEKGIDDKLLVVGGNIPQDDIPKLKDLGVSGVFPTGSRFEEITGFIKENAK